MLGFELGAQRIRRGQLFGHLEGEAGPDPLGVDHRPDVVDPGEGVERVLLAPGHRDGGGARCQQVEVARRGPDLSVGRDDLGVGQVREPAARNFYRCSRR